MRLVGHVRGDQRANGLLAPFKNAAYGMHKNKAGHVFFLVNTTSA
jgi:hypothetical protein